MTFFLKLLIDHGLEEGVSQYEGNLQPGLTALLDHLHSRLGPTQLSPTSQKSSRSAGEALKLETLQVV